LSGSCDTYDTCKSHQTGMHSIPILHTVSRKTTAPKDFAERPQNCTELSHILQPHYYAYRCYENSVIMPERCGPQFFTDWPMKPAVTSTKAEPGTELVQALADISRSALCRHSNETRAPIANPPNSAQLEGTPYHSSKLHLGLCSSVGMWRGIDRQTDRQTHRQPWPICTSLCYASREMQ